MDAIKEDVFKMVDKELAAANKKFPLFSSPHEAFAVLLEEVEEAQEEATNLEILTNNYWIGVKENHGPEAMHEEITAAYNTAVNLAIEAIQAAAMARKAILSNIELLAIEETAGE